MVYDVMVSCVREYNRCDFNFVVFDIVINVYKKMGFLNEVVLVFLCVSDSSILFILVCCNFLLFDLLKKSIMDFFWRVYDKMMEVKLGFDVYIYINLISVLCKEGRVKEGKVVFFEMEENGCCFNLVIYNVIINGFCRVMVLDEVLEFK